MKSWMRTAAVISLIACSHDEPPPEDNTIHLAGFVENGTGLSVASYWKDGVRTALAHEESHSQVSSLHVQGGKVTVGGGVLTLPNPPQVVYWQNNLATTIEEAAGNTAFVIIHNGSQVGVWLDGTKGWVYNKDGIVQSIGDTARHFAASGIALLADDLYISGSSTYHNWRATESTTFQHAQCWKNGQLVFREAANSNALAIFTHEGDVYMAGHVYQHEPPQSTACYWKNGIRVNLPGEKALATAVFVTDEHVYVAGTIDQQAVYWKDGQVINLTNGGTFSMANSVFVKGDDVYVAGYAHGHPAYWKNNALQTIDHQEKLGQVKFIVVGSN